MGGWPATGLVRVLVDDTDQERARRIIREWEAIQPDPEEAKTGSSKGITGFLFGLITGGAIEIVDPKRSNVASAGHVVLYNFDELHWGRDVGNDGWTIAAAYLSPTALLSVAEDIGAPSQGTFSFSESVTQCPAVA